MGNYINTCVDCGPKANVTTDISIKTIKDLKNSDLRAKGLLNLNYSELPEILKEKGRQRIERKRLLSNTDDVSLKSFDSFTFGGSNSNFPKAIANIKGGSSKFNSIRKV